MTVQRSMSPCPRGWIQFLATVMVFLEVLGTVPTNWASLNAFRYYVQRLWLRALRRRSQKAKFAWERMEKLADDRLPKPQILHPWPHLRFAVRHSR